MIATAEQAFAALLAGHQLLSDRLTIRISGLAVTIRSDSPPLLEILKDYFVDYLNDAGESRQHYEVYALESKPVVLSVGYVDWTRDAGKTGRKDSYCDLPNGRLIRKVKTGMVFLQSASGLVAAGPCVDNPNQVINFINAQVMNHWQQSGWLLCHAAGIVTHEVAIAFAGFSGGGKSTLMLRLMHNPEVAYLTNDRLLIDANGQECLGAGIAKLPRINPGTLIHDPYLRSLASNDQVEAWTALPKQELWHLEEKYDVPITQVYGRGRLCSEVVRLNSLVILNWQHQSELATSLTQVNLAERRDLVTAVMKSAGPFYQDTAGVALADGMALDQERYLSALGAVAVYEITGAVDFESAVRLIQSNIFSRL